MSVFSYTAKDLQGEYHKGEIETVDEHQAANLLRKKKLIVIRLKSVDKNSANPLDRFLKRVSFSDVVVMTRQLSTMISSGLVLSEAIDILIDQQENGYFKTVLTGVSADIKGGIDFATSMEKYPNVFPPIYTRLVRAGQVSGKLDSILLQLADSLEKDREFQGKVRGAMIYPAVVSCMMLAVMLIMVFFVMPKLLGLYKDSGLKLPFITQVMITVANLLINFWWALLLVIIIGVLSFRRFISSPEGRSLFDKVILKLPIIGKIANLVALTNFTRTFSLLVGSGISILDAIRIVSNVVGNSAYRESLESSYKGVERGLSFSSQLIGSPVFPKVVGQMIKTGEETGKLDTVMAKLSSYFESETDNTLKNVTALIEPLILIVLGLGVGLLVVSVILPIYQLTTNVGQ